MLLHQIAFTVLPQHLIGLITALLLFSATRRVTGLVWSGLLPAPMVLLGPDEILLEHAIMSEGWAIAIAMDSIRPCGPAKRPSRGGGGRCRRTAVSRLPRRRFSSWPSRERARSAAVRRVWPRRRRARGLGAARAGGAARGLLQDCLDIPTQLLRSGLAPSSDSATSTGLDPQLDFTNTNRGEAVVVAAIKQDLETFYGRFTVQPLRSGGRFLHDWQSVIKFGAPALSITTVLTLIGLAIGRAGPGSACCCLASAACHCNSHRAHRHLLRAIHGPDAGPLTAAIHAHRGLARDRLEPARTTL